MPRRKFDISTKFAQPKAPLYTPKRPRLLSVAENLYGSTLPLAVGGVVIDGNIMERDEDNPDTTSIHVPPSQTYHDNHQHGEPPAAAPDSPIGPLYDSGEEEDDNDFTFLPEKASVAPEIADDSNGLYLLDNIQMGVELLQLCSQAQVPLYFYDRILRIFKKFVDRGTKVSTVPSRELLMKHLKSKIPFIEP